MRFHNLALFIGGAVFGSAGFKILASRDAKKVYTHDPAVAEHADTVLQMKDGSWI